MADSNIKRPQNRDTLRFKNGDTSDIIKVVLEAIRDPKTARDTADFSKKFEPNPAGMQKLYWWLKDNVRYVEDPIGYQYIKDPSRLWDGGNAFGDCKSFTVFLCSVFRNLNLDFTVRFTTYDKGSKNVTHVFPIVHLQNGETIIMDAVWTTFNEEKTPRYKTINYKMSEIIRLSGIGDTTTDVKQHMMNLEADTAHMNQYVHDIDGDVTAMTVGEFNRFMTAQRLDNMSKHAKGANGTRLKNIAHTIRTGNTENLAGIGAAEESKVLSFLAVTAQQNQPAFVAPNFQIEGVGNVFEDVNDWGKKQWKKMNNWMFKKALPEAGHGLFFTYIKSVAPGAIGAEVIRRADRQTGFIKWLRKYGKFDEQQIMLGIDNACIKHYGIPVKEFILEAQIKETNTSGQNSGKKGSVGCVDPATCAALATGILGIASLVLKFYAESVKPVFENGDEADPDLIKDSGAAPDDDNNEGDHIKTPPKNDAPPKTDAPEAVSPMMLGLFAAGIYLATKK